MKVGLTEVGVPYDNVGWRTGALVVDGRGREWLVNVEWGVMRGRAEPRQISFRSRGDYPASVQSMKEVVLSSLLVDMQGQVAEELTSLSKGKLDLPSEEGQMEARYIYDPVQMAAAAEEARRFGAQRGRRLSPEILAEVARVYREAYRDRRPVQQAVATATGCSVSMAAKRIMAARKAGLLEGIGEQ